MSSPALLSIPLEKLFKAAWNYKTTNDDKQEKLKANIKRNGQVENLIVRDLGNGVFEVVNGNHRLDAMRDLGFEEAVCFNLGSVTEAQAMRVAVETNETRFATNNVRMAELLKELLVDFDADELSETMPFSKDRIEELASSLGFNPDVYVNTGYGEPDDPTPPKTVRCPDCGEEIVIE